MDQAGAASLPPPLAVVTVPRLNVRSGPGLENNPVAVALEGQQLQVVGEFGSCRWLQIIRDDGSLAWVSGLDIYVRFTTPCNVVQNFQFAPPSDQPASGQTIDSVPAPDDTNNNVANEAAAPAATSREQLGCFVFQNPLGVVVTITLTDATTNVGNTFGVEPRTDFEQCFIPGQYTYTLDAPPPWESTNGQISIDAGERLIFQIRPEEL